MLFKNGSSSGDIRICFSEAVRLKKQLQNMKNTGASYKHECYTIQEKKLEACMKLHNVYKNLPNPLLNELITIENLYNIVYHCGE